MSKSVRFLITRNLLILLWCFGISNHLIFANTETLLDKPVSSPEKTYSANVEWNSVGYIGRVAIIIYNKSNAAEIRVELPQINPSPANLAWINEEWVVCETIISEQGSAFFYVHVPSKRGYLIEILEPDKTADWIIRFRCGSESQHFETSAASLKTSSLFPILLRNLPTDGIYYYTPEFATLLQDAVEAFLEWKNKKGIKEIIPISEVANLNGVGSLVVVRNEKKPFIAAFPGGTTTTREMLAATQLITLPDELTTSVLEADYSNLKLNWTNTTGSFELKISVSESSEPVSLSSFRGELPNMRDRDYTGPTVEDLVKADESTIEANSPGKPSSVSKKSPVKSTIKKSVPKSKPSSPKKPPPRKSTKKASRAK